LFFFGNQFFFGCCHQTLAVVTTKTVATTKSFGCLLRKYLVSNQAFSPVIYLFSQEAGGRKDYVLVFPGIKGALTRRRHRRQRPSRYR